MFYNKKFLNEIKLFSIILIISIIITKIVFFKEGLLGVIRFTLGFYWTFILPGYFIIDFWRENIGFFERFVVSFPISVAIVGISSYYLGIAGIHTKVHHIIVPSVIILVCASIKIYKIKKNKIVT